MEPQSPGATEKKCTHRGDRGGSPRNELYTIDMIDRSAPAQAGEVLWMQEPYGEGVASHTGPESCVDDREDMGEALTGVHAGRVLSRENSLLRSADVVPVSGRQYRPYR